jgi:hypothetical protein
VDESSLDSWPIREILVHEYFLMNYLSRSCLTLQAFGIPPDGDHLPMIWDAFRHLSPRTHWIAFKYQGGAAPAASPDGLSWRKADLHACCGRMNRRPHGNHGFARRAPEEMTDQPN